MMTQLGQEPANHARGPGECGDADTIDIGDSIETARGFPARSEEGEGILEIRISN
jgi:hypothetical protein